MWRLGVTRTRGIAREIADGSPGARRFSLLLLRELATRWDPADEKLLERIYAELVVSGNVHKTTRRDRFKELDAKLVEELLLRFPEESPLRIHDLGASSGITSLELYRAFQDRRAIELRASDWFDSLYVVELPRAGWSVIFDAERAPLQYLGYGFVLSATRGKNREGRRYPLNFLLTRGLDRVLLRQAEARLTEALPSLIDPDGRGAEHHAHGAMVIRLPLLHPEVQAFRATHPGFSFGRHDAFQPTERRYHLIRALNLLNPGYFPKERLVIGIQAAGGSLVEGGVLVVGRTLDEQDRRTRATAFVRRGNALAPLWDLHEGSEIRALIEETDLRDGAHTHTGTAVA